jgi:hypothetical protein
MGVITHMIAYNVNTSPLEILQQLDLAEWEAAYHWASFEQKTIAAGCHLEKHDECLARIEAIKAELNRALCEATVLP